MTKIIFVAGAPGSGKTTVCRLLKPMLHDCPYIDYGYIREFHLNPTWSNESDQEEQMSFENLIFILKNYIKNAYPYILVTDLLDKRILEIPTLFDSSQFYIFSLTINNADELKKRVLNETRDSGYRNVVKATKWNQNLLDRKFVINEQKMDNSHNDPHRTAKTIFDSLKATV